ncbi:tRNA uridine-5-carboxymethylaminomethyl(34) synthesis GTPase MnmE [Sphingomonas naphthae]|uniref:tRNA modification GTPase MnmE n=1 Tax=Sphingomonas naphthae TaxID=1813468 RepID=A0ABY7TTF2_9SPHN|nr:tRNA uridine-5-carboxymethylaminomethyl(34) synthesis GTPase MnmE [Sphingomonas naphthae]WCT75494.1 tRNA uridine-5-carboxymethylaminomethyl(34) synthesis GTPase MnmE [Sphingomonas naphthae]
MRVSGPGAGDVPKALGARRPPPREARLARLADPTTGETLDRALILWFPGPNSATGEDLLELHLHGGRAVVAAVQRVLAGLPGLRPAEPGEFTRRAMLNGRLDLAEAEGLADLLSAETEIQRRNAIRVAEGGLSRAVEIWRRHILDHAATIEAVIDYGDEVGDDIDIAPLQARVGADAEALRALLASPPAERLRDGLRVVLAGPPNAGKSSLMNALAGREAAIVSPIAGTTRDRVEAALVIDGFPILLTDTAGLREEGDDPIEAIGIRRAQDAMDEADVVLWLGPEEDAIDRPGLIRVAAKSDLATAPDGRLAVSVVSGEGLGALRARLVAAAQAQFSGDLIALNQRQRTLVADAAESLQFASAEPDILLVAEHLRQSCSALDALTGRAGVEDMLDSLFGRFCLGK